MKIKMLCVIIMLCAVIGSSALMSVSAVPERQAQGSASQVEGAVVARFLNMLNHNRVYGEDFLSVDEMVNESVAGMLELRDEAHPDFVAETYVKNFMYSMYGVEIVDMSELNDDMPMLEGYVYILPRGYSEYHHTDAKVRVNEDGTYTVTTEVTVSSHDGQSATYKCVSMFVENSNSDFGYNMIASDIIEDAAEI